MQLSTEPPSFEGALDAPKALQSVMINRKDYYGRNCNLHFWFRRGLFCGSVSMCEWIFAGVFSTGRTTSAEARVVFPRRALRAPKGEWWFPPGELSAPKGEWPYTEAPTMWSCPD